MIGGLAYWDATRPVAEVELRTMAGRRVGQQLQIMARTEPAGFFASTTGAHVESSQDAWVIADLDLLNVDDLRAAAGAPHPDALLLAPLYALEGPSFVRRLQGAFAIALWDRGRQTLLLAIDRFGIKRMYYAANSMRASFASCSSALLGGPDTKTAVDPTSVFNYLNFGYVPAPGSIFAGIHRLSPGHIVVLRPDGGAPGPYWDMRYREERTSLVDGERRLYRGAQDAVRTALRGLTADQTGAYLSGGTDSSTIVGLMSNERRGRVKAFSVGFQEERYDELRYASLAARHFDAEHFTRIVGPGEALQWMPSLVAAFDEPFGNNSAIGTFFAADMARALGVRWLIAGDGGDEIFGGNERYATDHLFARYALIPRLLRRDVVEPALRRLHVSPTSVLGRAQRYVRRANLPNPERFYSYELFFAQQASTFLAPDFLRVVNGETPLAVLDRHYRTVDATSDLNRLLYLDLKLTIGDNDLLKVTRTAELAGLNVRFPFLDASLVEFTGTLPPRLKLRGTEKRYLFKRAFRHLLPAETLAKPKHGFGVPTAVWLKSHPAFRALVHDTLLADRARQRGYFRPGAVETLLERHSRDASPFYGDLVWTVLMLELWHRHHVDGAPAV